MHLDHDCKQALCYPNETFFEIIYNWKSFGNLLFEMFDCKFLIKCFLIILKKSMNSNVLLNFQYCNQKSVINLLILSMIKTELKKINLLKCFLY